MAEPTKSLVEFKADQLAMETRIKLLNQQIIMLTGALNYISNEIAKLEADNVNNSGKPQGISGKTGS